ncbi:MAG: DUF448 domain-containing protein [Bdellovibrionales bacterium]
MASKQTYENSERTDSVSERRCLVRGESGSKSALIRFVVGPDNTLVPDFAEKLPGRGLWVTADAACITEAIAKKLFGRAAKENVVIPANLLDQMRTQLRLRVMDLLGLAKKAGRVALGADSVQQELKKRALCGIIIAADASDSGFNDMQQRTSINVLQVPFSAADLGAALGRDNTVYIGLRNDKQGNTLLRECARLIGLTKEAS